jgi:hypothetical protein
LIKPFAVEVARAPTPSLWSHGDLAVVFVAAAVRLLAPAVFPPLLHPSPKPFDSALGHQQAPGIGLKGNKK